MEKIEMRITLENNASKVTQGFPHGLHSEGPEGQRWP